jgi:hypothetical protein
MTASPIIEIRPWYRRGWGIAVLFVAASAFYLSTLVPSDEGPWRADHERMLHAKIHGRELTIYNVRDFSYDSKGDVTEKKYLDKTYALDELSRGWFGLSHFGPYGLAHSFLSFEFDDGQYLALSIEARIRPGGDYNPLVGLFRQYTKIYIASTERDVIGLRSHVRGETVLLYPISTDQADLEAYFLQLIDDANSVYETAEFYNTVLDNCLTNLIKYSARLSSVSPANFRILLPGHTDRLTYAFGITPNDISLEAARQRATVDPQLGAIDDPDFSSVIRCGWDDYPSIDIPACPTSTP